MSKTTSGRRNRSFDPHVEEYSARWRDSDRKFFDGLRPGNTQEGRRVVLQEILGKYKVARNLPRAHDEGLGKERYQPLVEVLDRCRRRHPTATAPADVVLWFRDELAKRYGGDRPLSLSSKVLWFVYRSPIVIYDELVRRALDSPPRDYHAYLKRWTDRFRDARPAISLACARAEGESWSKERWFHERVFDLSLWYEGNRA